MKDPLKHTKRIRSLIDAGKIDEAAAAHNQKVKADIGRAKAGEVIELTDLMAAKEVLVEAVREKDNDGSGGVRLKVIVVVEGGIAGVAYNEEPDQVDVEIVDLDGLEWLTRDERYELWKRLESGDAELANLALHLHGYHAGRTRSPMQVPFRTCTRNFTSRRNATTRSTRCTRDSKFFGLSPGNKQTITTRPPGASFVSKRRDPNGIHS